MTIGELLDHITATLLDRGFSSLCVVDVYQDAIHDVFNKSTDDEKVEMMKIVIEAPNSPRPPRGL